MSISEIIIIILTIGFWLILGLLPVVVIVSLIYEYFKNSRKEKLDEYRKLTEFVGEDFYNYQKQHNYSQNKALRKFFSDKYIYEKAKELKTEQEWEWEYYSPYLSEDELKNKRIYSYKYEKVVYEIFGKWGYHLSDDVWLIHKQLGTNYIIVEIAKLLRLNFAESIKLFDEFIQNGLIQYTEQYDKSFCIIGYTLHNWNYLSTEDYSFSKWKNDSLHISSPSATIDEFKKAFGNFEIVNIYNKWIMQYNRSSNEKMHIWIDDEYLIREIKGNPRAYVSSYSFGNDNSDETKQRIMDFITKNEDSLYIANFFYLKLNTKKYNR